ncbi:MAG: hypothetical protein HYW48_11385 [Deltaproteobacteria bacterium]|nr:hypothetical protein [Deltaproteobacteria bacterium]
MEETAQLVPPRNPLGERPFALLRAGFSLAPPTPPSLFAPSGLRITWFPNFSPRTNCSLVNRERSHESSKDYGVWFPFSLFSLSISLNLSSCSE